jgi:hypothetical protein
MMTRISASEDFVETLAAQGVTHVFGIVGSAHMDALDLFPAAGIRLVSAAHEQGAGHMANGFSLAIGKHGVCIARRCAASGREERPLHDPRAHGDAGTRCPFRRDTLGKPKHLLAKYADYTVN